MKLGIGEDFMTGLEADLRASAIGFTRYRQWHSRYPETVLLAVAVTVAVNQQAKIFRQCIDHGNPYAVQSP